MCNSIPPATEEWFVTYTLQVPAYEPEVEINYPKEHAASLKIDTCWPDQVHDLFVEIDYEGMLQLPTFINSY